MTIQSGFIMPVAYPTVPAYSQSKRSKQSSDRVARSDAEATIANEQEIRAGLSQHLTRLWRYAVVLSH